jgi:hypothetical protein
MKFRCPYLLYENIKLSNRDSSLTIILPDKTNKFLYKASLMWNAIQKGWLDLVLVLRILLP